MGCRLVRVVRVDNIIVDWRNVLVEWRNASHCGHLEIIHHVVKQGLCDGLSTRTSRTSGKHHCRLEKRACRVVKCISLWTLRNYPSYCRARALRWVVDSYESYEWTTSLSTGETYLSSGEMHLIVDT